MKNIKTLYTYNEPSITYDFPEERVVVIKGYPGMSEDDNSSSDPEPEPQENIDPNCAINLSFYNDYIYYAEEPFFEPSGQTGCYCNADKTITYIGQQEQTPTSQVKHIYSPLYHDKNLDSRIFSFVVGRVTFYNINPSSIFNFGSDDYNNSSLPSLKDCLFDKIGTTSDFSNMSTHLTLTTASGNVAKFSTNYISLEYTENASPNSIGATDICLEDSTNNARILIHHGSGAFGTSASLKINNDFVNLKPGLITLSNQ